EQAGLLPGDLVAQVDGWSTAHEELATVVAHIGGEPGTEVTLAVLRDGEPLEFHVRRAPVRDLALAQVKLEEELCPALVGALFARDQGFAALKGVQLPQGSAGRT